MTERTTAKRLLELRDKIEPLAPLIKAERLTLEYSSDNPFIYRLAAAETYLLWAIARVEEAADLLRDLEPDQEGNRIT